MPKPITTPSPSAAASGRSRAGQELQASDAGTGAFTSDEGHYEFWTCNPGAAAGTAPFIAAIVYARGLPDKLHTRIYLPDDEEALAADALLSSLPPDERATLIASRTPDGNLRHDIRLQGEKETVFLAF